MTAIVVCDYFAVRRGAQYHVGDLYRGNSTSAYWYVAGFNPRAFAAWIAGMAPLLPGFARAIQGTSDGNGWDRIYQISYFYGFGATFVAYWALFAVWPMQKQRGSSPFVLEGVAEMVVVVEGVEQESVSVSGSARGEGGEDVEKGVVAGVDGKAVAKTFAG